MLIKTESDRQEFIKKAQKVDISKPWIFSAEPYKPKRSVNQNSLLYKWLAEIGKQSGNGAEYERNFCKFTYGCMILVADSSEFAAFYSNLVDNLDYEQAIESMAFISLTSLFNVKQFTQYLNHIETYAAKQGYHLTKPDDLYNSAMGIK